MFGLVLITSVKTCTYDFFRCCNLVRFGKCADDFKKSHIYLLLQKKIDIIVAMHALGSVHIFKVNTYTGASNKGGGVRSP